MLYGCTHMAKVGVKGLTCSHTVYKTFWVTDVCKKVFPNSTIPFRSVLVLILLVVQRRTVERLFLSYVYVCIGTFIHYVPRYKHKAKDTE